MVVFPVYMTLRDWANMPVETIHEAFDGLRMAGNYRERLAR
jgi:hypothetical protein